MEELQVRNTGAQGAGAPTTQSASFQNTLQSTAPQAPLPQQPIAQITPTQPAYIPTPTSPAPPTNSVPPPPPSMRRKRHIPPIIKKYAFIALLLLVLGGGVFAASIVQRTIQSNNARQSEAVDPAGQFDTQQLPLGELASIGSVTVEGDRTLSINGQLRVNNSLVLVPTSQPTGAIAGQMYYDQSKNVLSYYNGDEFVDLLGRENVVFSLAGLSGNITLGNGLNAAGGSLSNTGVLSLQGQSGDVTLTSGGGMAIDGTTLTNTGVLALGGQSGIINLGSGLSISNGILNNTGVLDVVAGTANLVVTKTNGTITISDIGGGGGGTVASPGGTAGRIAKFTGVQTIADSLLSESGTVVTVNGDLSVSGALSLGTPLSVGGGGTGAGTGAGARANLGAAASGANSDITSLSGLTTALSVLQGGTGVSSLTNNGVVIGQGTGALATVTAGAAGLCLVSTAGAPSFQICPGGGGGGVTSLNGLTGGLSIANSSGLGTTITIDDASTTAKGIAQFSSTNFSVASGIVNTIQNINASATPTFAGINTNTITPSSTLTIGATGQALVLQGNTSTTLSATSGINSTTISFQTPTANVTYRFATAIAGTYDICTTVGNCAGSGGGVTTAGGTANRLAKFTGSQAINNSTITDDGVTVTTSVDAIIQGGDLTLGTTGQLGSIVLHDGNGQATTLQSGDTSSDLTFILPTVAGAANQCIKKGSGNQLVFDNCDGGAGGSSASLQTAYNNGNGITTTDARDIDIVLANTATDSNFDLLVADGSTGFVSFSRANGTGTADPAQMLLINNLDTDRALPIGLNFQAASGGITTAIDASDADIVTALNVGGNDIVGTTGAIDFTNFDVSGAGTVTAAANINSTGGAIQTNSTTRLDNSGNLVNIGNVTLAGAISGGTTITSSGTINTTGGGLQTNSTTRIDSSGNLINIGNVTTSGNASIGGTLGITGVSTLSGDLLANGNTTIGNAATDRLTVTAQIQGASPLVFQGATDNSFTATIAVIDPTANRTISLPDETGTLCLQNSTNCGFALSSGSGNYIQNQSAADQTADFRISGTGRANTAVLTPLLDTASAAVLNIGTTNATAINLNKSTAITGTLSVTGTINSSGGSLQTNNTTRVDNSGNLVNIGAITGSGALALQSGGATTVTLDAGGAAGISIGTTNANALTIAHAGIQTTIQGSATFNEQITVGNGSGNDYLEFAEEAGNPACAAGDYRVWANSSDGRIKKCQNGTITDLDTSGAGTGVTLQDAYTNGNTISTTNARDLAFTLADTATDSNLTITTATGSTSQSRFILADGAGTTPPTELVLIDMQDTNLTLANGLTVAAATGGVITDGVDVSDAEIVNAINIGSNDILSGGVSIASAELNLLDGHDVALVDTNDAVSTAIIGTGALNSGSITSGFGSIDTGADTISTTGAINAGTLNTSGTTTLNGSLTANGDTILGNATTDRLTITSQLLGASPLAFQGGTDDAFTTTLAITDPTANRTVTLGNESGTVCLQNSTNCGFALTSGSGNYIQNQSASDQTADFRISGTGRANTSLLTPLLDTATGVALTIGGTATAINLNEDTTITGTLSVTGTINTSGGVLQTNGTTRIDTSGNLVNIVSLTASGNATLQGGTVNVGTSSQSGSLVLNDGSSNTGTLQVAALGQNTIYTLPDPGGANATICLSTGNCAGSGGGVTGSGTNNRLSKFTATGSTIGDSTITDDGTSVTTSVDLIVQGGDVTAGTTSQLGSFVLHDGNGQTTTIQAGDSTGNLTFVLPTSSGAANQCIKKGSGNQLIFDNCDGGAGGSSATLQSAYDAGNTLTTTDARNLNVTLANTTTDSLFNVSVATGSTGYFAVSRADGVGTADPAQLALIDNLDTDRAQPIGLKIQSAGGGLTTAIDVSDAEIGTAVNIGSNDILTSGATISAAELDLLDGHDVALVDTNDAVATAITGTGALGVGSITSGFGSIDTGADAISTTGAISAGTASISGNTTVGGTLGVTGLTTLNDLLVNGSATLGDVSTDSLTVLATISGGNPFVFEGLTNDANETTLVITDPTADRTVTFGDESGTICLQNSTNCGFALSSGSGNYIQNQSAADQTADFRISGTGRANTSLLTPLLDTATAVALNIGTTNATVINLNQNTTLASGKTLTVQGAALFQPTVDGTSVFNVKTALGNNVFTVDSANGRVGINLGSNNTPSLANEGLEIKGALKLSGSATQIDNFITPLGTTVQTKINIPLYNPAAFGQLVAMGLPSTAASTTRALTLFDARSGAHQPTLGIISPNENQIFGLSWDGSNTTSLLKTSGDNVALQANSLNLLTAKNNGGAANVGIGNNATGGYPLDVTGDVNTSTQYRIGGTVICTSSGCTPAAGSNNYIQNSTAPQTANFNVVSAAAGSVTATIQGAASQSATILEVKANGVSNPLFSVGSSGAAIFRNSSNATTAFQIQNSTGASLFSVDTTNTLVRVPTVGSDATLSSATGAIQIGADNTSNLAFDDNEIIARNNGGVATLFLQNLGGGLTVNANAAIFQNNVNGTTSFQILNAAGTSVATVDTIDGELELGQGSTLTGTMLFRNATNGNVITLSSTTPTANRAILLPNEAGTICLQNSTSCGFATTSGSGSYIQNQSASDQTADFRISGSGRANTSLLTPLLDAATAVALNIGGTATAINLNEDTAVTGTLSVTGAINSSGGTLQTNSTTRIDNSGNLVNIGTVNGQTISSAASFTGTVAVTTLGSAGSTAVCRNGSNQLATCASNPTSVTLQQAYDAGNTITTTDARSVSIALADTATDSNLLIDLQCDTSCGSNGRFAIQDDGTDVFSIAPTGAALFKNTSTTALQIQKADATTVLTVDTSNSRVGIGNLTPSEALHVDGKLRFVATETVFTGNAKLFVGTQPDTSARGGLNGTSLTTIADYGNGTNVQGIVMQWGGTTDAGGFKISDDGLILWGSGDDNIFQVIDEDANATRFIIEDGGDVGIGLASANSKLDVAGDVNISSGSAYKINGSDVLEADSLTFTAATSALIQPATSQALNITAHATSTWSTDSGNLFVRAASTNTLDLDTGGAGTVAIGNANATTINMGNNAIAHTINIGTGAAAQTVTLGSTNSTSTTTIQAGTGNLNLSTNSASASIIAKSSTNGSNAFQVQNAGGTPVLKVDTINSQTQARAGADSATLGSEMITSNNFSTSWTGTGWTLGASSATHTSGTTALSPTTPLTVAANTGYLITFTLASTTTGTLTPGIGGVSGNGVSSNTTHSQVVYTSGTGNLTFTPTSDFNGTISAVSVKQLTVYEATLALQDSTGVNAQLFRTGKWDTHNIFLGAASGRYNIPNSGDSSGYGNTAVGSYSLASNTTGKFNTAIGNYALQGNTTGVDNSAVGRNALNNNSIGSYNTAFGSASLYNNTSGSNNTAFGHYSLNGNNTGSNNTAMGYYAGFNDLDGFYTFSNLQNSTVLGSYAQAQASNTFILGGAASNAVNVGIGTTKPDNVFSVSPVQYNTGTASQSGTTVTGSGTTFTAAMIGSKIIFANGTSATITGFTSATSLTVTPSQTVGSQNYRIHRQGFQVTSAGFVGVGTSAPSNAIHVDQGTSTASFISFTAGTTTGTTNLDGTTLGIDAFGSAFLTNWENQAMFFATNSTVRLKLTAAGNVGIGDNIEAVDAVQIDKGVGANGLIRFTVGTTTGTTNTDGFVTGVDLNGAGYVYNYENLPVHIGTSGFARIRVAGGGNVGIGPDATTFTAGQELEVNGDIRLDANGTATTNGLCHSGANTTTTFADRDIVACSAAPSDIAEWYETKQGVEAGDLVMTTNETFTYDEELFNPTTGEPTGQHVDHTISVLGKGSNTQSGRTMGIVSTSPYQVFGESVKEATHVKNPRPIALSGRVPLKVTNENGAIAIGDPLTASSTPGHAMKATNPGMIVGYALENFTGTNGKINTFVEIGYYAPPAAGTQGGANQTIQNGGNADLSSLNVSGQTTLNRLTVTGDAIFKGKVTVKELTVQQDLRIEGHLVGGGNTPIISAHQDVTATIDGTDTAGSITVTAEAAISGELAQITFAKAYANTPRISITATNAAGAKLPVYPEKTATGFKLRTDASLTKDTVYSYDFIVIQ